MDMAMGADPYNSFKRYQTALLKEYTNLSQEFGFHSVNAGLKPDKIQSELRKIVSGFFSKRHFHATPIEREIDSGNSPPQPAIQQKAS
jgi:hypothetical protein